MVKDFHYKGYDFVITVRLGYRREKHIGGKVWHEITAICLQNSEYKYRQEVLDAWLERGVAAADQTIHAFVDVLVELLPEANYVAPEKDQRLLALGFE